MSEAKHTPGPWRTGTDEDAHVIYDDNLDAIADTLRDDGDAETERANAHLIAAAPDLLAVVEALRGPLPVDPANIAALLDWAIAKAKGEFNNQMEGKRWSGTQTTPAAE